MPIRPPAWFLSLASITLVAVAPACSSSPDADPTARAESALTPPPGTIDVPPTLSIHPVPIFDACDPNVDCCVSSPQNFPPQNAYELRLRQLGCTVPQAFAENHKLKGDHYWFFSLCPMRPLANMSNGGVDYHTMTKYDGPLPDLLQQFSHTPPIWSAFPRERSPCMPPIPDGWTMERHDPNCPAGCESTAF